MVSLTSGRKIRLYFSRPFLEFYAYLVILLIATPYLPLLINRADSYWSRETVLHFVFAAEVSIGLMLVVFLSMVFIYNRSKFPLAVSVTAGLVLTAASFYFIIPNPYELTHIPEYALLGILISRTVRYMRALGKVNFGEGTAFIASAAITGVIGALDEIYQGFLPARYFTWYDIFLNALGGILGITVLWGLSKE